MPRQKEDQYDHFLGEGTGLENIRHYRSFLARRRLIESVFGGQKFRRMLVIGAGSGIELPVLSKYAGGLVVCDLFQNAINSARKLCRTLGIRNVGFVRASAEKLPFRTGEFDALYSKDVLHHVPDHHKALREYLRVSRKVFILESNWRHPITRFYFGPVPIEKNMKERNVPENLLAAIESAGASDMEVKYLESYPYLIYLPKIEGRKLNKIIPGLGTALNKSSLFFGDAALSFVFGPAWWAVSRLSPGLSSYVLVVCSKSSRKS